MFRHFGLCFLLGWLIVAPCLVASELGGGEWRPRSKTTLGKLEQTSPVAATRMRTVAERLNHSLRCNRAPWNFQLDASDTVFGVFSAHNSPVARVIQFDAQHLVTHGLRLQV